MSRCLGILSAAVLFGVSMACSAQTMKAPDITKQPTLYVVPYAHLDTQWRWEFPQTISEYLLKTMRLNFYYIDKYPHYVFNWTGSNRYRLMKEYYPADYERLKQYVAEGRWYPAGASVEENDVNLPSAESIFRQVLYGNEFYRREFGKTSEDYMLPDCFGFPASLPTILAHAGVRGFSTQKLSANWQPGARVGGPGSPEQTPEGIPFNVGLWKGPDGESVIAALNPSRYGSRIRYDLSKTPRADVDEITTTTGGGRATDIVDWPARVELDGKVTGVFADYHYIGIGDNGGATDEETAKMLEAIVSKGTINLPVPHDPELKSASSPALGLLQAEGQPVRVGDGPLSVIAATSDQMFRDIKPDMTARMPTYQGDLELINHSAGSLTSQAYHKRWNRKNEILADAAEKAATAAAWMGAGQYPQQRLTDAWTLVLAGQFHDVGAGTATPRAYQFVQNDDVIALNQFADVLTTATRSIASGLNTDAPGVPIVLYNSLNIDRQDVVEAKLPDSLNATNVQVYSPEGKPVPTQVEGGRLLFLARVPSVGFAVYSARNVAAPKPTSDLKVSKIGLENARYRVRLNDAGDITSVFDKSLHRELLSAPICLAISNDAPKQYPAWNMDFDQEQAPPRAYVSGPATIRVVEDGPVRVAVQVTRDTDGSHFVQTVSLSAGSAGNRVEFHDSVDWHTSSANLKAVFPLAAQNRMATYNWEVGTIQRPTAEPNQFEVASHYWIDLTDQSKTFGATVLTDVKNGSDKPDAHTIRLTLLRTPGFPPNITPQAAEHRAYSDQLSQDWGHHEILYGLAGHSGDWRQDNTDWQAYRLSTPVMAFTTSRHPGALGRTFSIVHVSNPDVRILALKKAEFSDATILRMIELHGETLPLVRVAFAGPISSAEETNGQEEVKSDAPITNGALDVSFTPYQPRTFALHLGAAPAHLAAITSEPVSFPYNLAASSANDTRSNGGFDAQGDALPSEMLPSIVHFNGVNFHLAAANQPDALIPAGQTIHLPAGDYNRIYLLAASANGDRTATFRVGETSITLRIENWTGFIGQWDTRMWKPEPDYPIDGKKSATPVPYRKDWAVSANHATWDLANHGSPTYSPRYPDDYLGVKPGYIKRDPLAWYVSHYHTPAGLNQPYAYSYLFGYEMNLPPDATTLTLPNDPDIRILAISVAHTPADVTPAHPLYDTLENQSQSKE
ncbi:MAG TPA: glycoside hydrolase family 38 C-terminal domain-containing protein [Acidobacteriaceae bacterium]|nr:glycoside hydrolase family 38 C-terminal domain-containing protein [Acidobacteriaceae bacterium]